MRPEFEKGDMLRPDPYLDWEVRTRPGASTRGNSESRRGAQGQATEKRWCSLYIRIKPTSDGKLVPNLDRLSTAVARGRLDEDPKKLNPTIRMANDERHHLQDVMKLAAGGEIDPDDDKVLLQFFVYRLEPLIYAADGAFKSTALYDVVLAGPPIADLSFDPGNDAIQETKFASLPGINKYGVAIGIIDDGIAFAHERFRDAAGGSRVMAIWLQDIERGETGTPNKKGVSDQGVAFGRRLDNGQINELLARHTSDTDIYRELGLIDFGRNTYNPLASRATHGTHVLDAAAGYDPANQHSGSQSARLRPILAVQLPSIATLDTSGVTMGSYVLQAVRQIILWAEKLGTNVPLVINFSYGLSAGPKDGTHQLERALHELISYRNRRASTCLVLPAGNTYRARTTARMTLAKGEARTLDWMILPDDQTPNFLEIWLDAELGTRMASPVEVTLTPPGGLPSKAAQLTKGKLNALKLDGKSVSAAYYDAPGDKRSRIFIAVNQTASSDGRVDCAPAGRWRLTIRNRTDQDVSAHFYIQRDNTPMGYRRPGRQSFFDHPEAYGRDEATGDYNRPDDQKCPITRLETLSALATTPAGKGNNKGILVVGAAEASGGMLPARYTSSGPTVLRDGPDCSAVTEEGRGHWGVPAAGTLSGSLVRMSGTSVAAPQIVRRIADSFASDRAPGPPPRIDQRAPQEAPIGVPDQDSFPASAEHKEQLGEFVVQRRPNRRLLQRRYPAGPAPEPNYETTD
jgi:subtilisin family serine protease